MAGAPDSAAAEEDSSEDRHWSRPDRGGAAVDPQAGVPGLPGWAAIHTPGHTPGHLSLYRRSDGVLITGDGVVTVDLNSLLGILTNRQGVFGPPRYST